MKNNICPKNVTPFRRILRAALPALALLAAPGCQTPLDIQGGYSTAKETITGGFNNTTNGVTVGGTFLTGATNLGGTVTVGK